MKQAKEKRPDGESAGPEKKENDQKNNKDHGQDHVSIDSNIVIENNQPPSPEKMLEEIIEDPQLLRQVYAQIRDIKTQYAQIAFTSAFEIVQKNPQLVPIIQGFLNKRESMIIHSKGGAKKSMIALYIALEAGKKFQGQLFDTFTFQKPEIVSLFLQTENSPASINTRLRGMAGDDPEAMAALTNIYFPKIQDDILAIGFDFGNPGFVQFCIGLVKKINTENKKKIDLLFVDPLISFLDGDENDSRKMRACLDGITAISQATEVTPIVISHDNKNNEYRGSSASFDWARNVIKLKSISIGENRITDFKDKKPIMRIAQTPATEMICEKSNNMKTFDKIILSMGSNFRFKKVSEAIPPQTQERCLEVQQALKDLDGYANSNLVLAKAVSELTGRGVTTCKKDISDAVKNDYVKAQKTKGGSTNAYSYSL